MVTSELLYSAFGGVVESYITPVSYVHDTNRIKDRDAQLTFPACGWKLPTPAQSIEGEAQVFTDSFKLELLFVDQTASDRSGDQMLVAHSRMEVIAKHCVQRFFDLYVFSATTFEGVLIDLAPVGSIVYTPVFDDDTTMLTGVIVTFGVKATQPVCVDSFFA